MRGFGSKDAAREWVWDRLQAQGAARFPFPPRGRIPNFRGAEAAAERLLASPFFDGARCVKVNPDAPQAPLRAALLARGVAVLVPTPRLRGGFHLLDPERVPAGKEKQAATLRHMTRWAVPVAVAALPRVDRVVAGSVAVTPTGRRAGKGEGYSDLEYAILRELGHPAVPVATTVHELQVVASFPVEATDIPVHGFATPERLVVVQEPPAAPAGIEWDRLGEADLAAMPVLRELKGQLA